MMILLVLAVVTWRNIKLDSLWWSRFMWPKFKISLLYQKENEILLG